MKFNITTEPLETPKAPEFAQVLKKRREELGMTQTEVATHIGVSSMLLSHWENGRREPSLSDFEYWLEALSLDITITNKDY